MNGPETYCRPVVGRTKKTYLVLGIVIGAVLFYLLATYKGWLTF